MTSGGYRKGAGRPRNTGKYGEPTVPVRVPVSMVSWVQAVIDDVMKPQPPSTKTTKPIDTKPTKDNYDREAD